MHPTGGMANIANCVGDNLLKNNYYYALSTTPACNPTQILLFHTGITNSGPVVSILRPMLWCQTLVQRLPLLVSEWQMATQNALLPVLLWLRLHPYPPPSNAGPHHVLLPTYPHRLGPICRSWLPNTLHQDSSFSHSSRWAHHP